MCVSVATVLLLVLVEQLHMLLNLRSVYTANLVCMLCWYIVTSMYTPVCVCMCVCAVW